MATELYDGFDKYGPANTVFPSVIAALAAGGWNVSTNGQGNPANELTVIPGLNGAGEALQFVPGAEATIFLSKALSANYNRLVGGVRFSVNYISNTGGFNIVFIDSMTPQCSIGVQPLSGFITMNQGDNGALLEQSGAAVAYSTIHYIEWDITFGIGGSGSWTIWLDGVQIMANTGTTQQSANAYSNVFQFATATSGLSAGPTSAIDDVYLFNSTGSVNTAALLSNPIVVTQFPNADQQTQFANAGNVFGNTYSSDQSNYTMGNNTLYLAKFTPNVNCTVNDIVLLPESTNGTAEFKGVIYSDNSGVPNSLLSSGTQVTGCVIGVKLELPLATPQNLTANTPYWIGLIGNSNVAFLQFDGRLFGYTVANTYTSGAPATAPSMTGNQASLLLYGSCTGAATNWESMALNPPIGDDSSVTTTSTGIEDLYAFPNLPANVTEVYSVAVTGNAETPAAGSHTIDLITSSNGTSSAGSAADQAVTSSYTWYRSYFDVDPHTTLSWSIPNVNAAYHGMETIT